MFGRKTLLASCSILAGLAAFLVVATAGVSAAAAPVRIGILTDLSGPYAGIAGNDVAAAKMAVADAGGKILGRPVEIVVRDNQSKPETSNEKAKELYEKEKVDIIIDVPNSAAGLAVSKQALLHKKPFIAVTSGTTRYTGPDCNRYTFHWAYNDYMLSTASGLWVAKNEGKKWYTITADYAWGHDLLQNFTNALKQEGGSDIGNSLVALGTTDFTPYIIKAEAAKPQVLALLNAGKDTVNSTKQAYEFGLKKEGIKIVHALMFIDDIKAAGPQVFAGDYVAAPWYWKIDQPGVKEFVARWEKEFHRPPNWLNAGVYSAVTQYLKAVGRAKSSDPEPVIKAMEGYTFRDLFRDPGTIRARDHMVVGKAYIMQAKVPARGEDPWDLLKVVGQIPAGQAFKAEGTTGCSLGGF